MSVVIIVNIISIISIISIIFLLHCLYLIVIFIISSLSGTIYGDQQEQVSEPLNLLFRQTVDLSAHFSGLLPKLVFDTYDDINILIDGKLCPGGVLVFKCFFDTLSFFHIHILLPLLPLSLF